MGERDARAVRVLETIAGLSPRYGGPSYSVPRLSAALAAAGLEVSLLAVAEAGAAAAQNRQQGYSDIRSKWDFAGVPGLRALRWSSGFRSSVQQLARAHDVLHDHGLWLMPNLWAARAARAAKIPLVVSPRGMLSKAALRFSATKKRLMWYGAQGSLLRQAACLHATSTAEYEEIRRLGLVNPVAIIANGIDLPRELAEHDASKEHYVLSLGRLHPKKGLDRLIRAWASIEASSGGWRLRVVGPSERGYAEELAALAANLGCSKVSIEGEVSGADKWQTYREASLFVLPTRNENFGLSVAEALSCGVPAIATRNAPWQGLLSEGCGWWIDDDWQQLAQTLTAAMALSDSERRTMGRRGREWMAHAFAWPAIAQKMAEVYGWLAHAQERPDCVRID